MLNIAGTTLSLRKFEPEDVDALWSMRNDPEITAGLGGFSTGYSRRDLSEWIEAHRARRDEILLAIIDADPQVCIGHVGLYKVDHRSQKAEFAILIGSLNHHGRGLGERVTSFMIAYGFDRLNLNKISLTALSTNERAIRLYKKLGFHIDGIARQEEWRDGKFVDVVLMSLLRAEWTRPK